MLLLCTVANLKGLRELSLEKDCAYQCKRVEISLGRAITAIALFDQLLGLIVSIGRISESECSLTKVECESKVNHLDMTLQVDHDIAQGDVIVNDLFLVDGDQSFCEITDH